MGNDGGTIPTRQEILNFSLKKLGNTSNASSNSATTISKLLNSYKYCALSNNKLESPIISDAYGKLYNKEAVLLDLIENKHNDVKNKDFTSINDFVTLKIDIKHNHLNCIVSNTSIDLNNDNPKDLKLSDIQFSYIVPCGCTMNTKILKGLISSDHEIIKCPSCSNPFRSSDIIDINSQDEKVKEVLKERLNRLLQSGFYHNLKKIKPKKKHKIKQDSIPTKRIKNSS